MLFVGKMHCLKCLVGNFLLIKPLLVQCFLNFKAKQENITNMAKSSKPTFIPLQVSQLLVHISQGLRHKVFTIHFLSKVQRFHFLFKVQNFHLVHDRVELLWTGPPQTQLLGF